MIADTEIRERILTFAHDKFLAVGFSKVTLDEMAEELGISKKTFYKYFDSKEELLRECMRLRMQKLAKEIEVIVNGNAPFADKLTGVLMVIGKQVTKLNKNAQIDMQKVSPAVWKEIETFRRENIFSKIGKMIIQAREEKVFRPEVNEQLLLLMIFNCVQGIVNPDILSQNSFSAEEAFRGIFKTIFMGALSDEARKDFHIFDSPTVHI
jgi:AcrR family transcriptional regulator